MQAQTPQQTAKAGPSELAARQDAGRKKAPRKIIQIVSMRGIPEAVYALCDDGTLWHNYTTNEHWVKMPPIPHGDAQPPVTAQ